MKRKTARGIGLAMLAVAVAFVLYALNHPEGFFPWGSGVTYALYAVYAVVTAVLLIAPFGRAH